MVTRRPRSPGAEPPPGPDLLTPAATPAPTPPVHPDEFGGQDPAPREVLQPKDGAGLPAKRSKLAIAMDSVSHNVAEIERLDITIAEVELQYPGGRMVDGVRKGGHVFDLKTKEGRKLADKVRKDARESRLHVQRMKKQGTDLLNALKQELWGVADPQIARLDLIESNAKEQIEAHAAIESSRASKHEEAIAAISAVATGIADLRSPDILTRRATLMAIIVDDSYEEFEERAKKVWDETAAVLQEAFDKAVAREAAEEAQRAKDAKDATARQTIAGYKTLPQQCAGTGVENVTKILAGLERAVTETADIFGDLAEFVTMAREKAIGELRKVLADEEKAAAATTVVMDPSPITKHADDDGAEVAAPQDDSQGGLFEEHPLEQVSQPTLEEFADQVDSSFFYWKHPESESFGMVTGRAALEALMDSDPLVEEIYAHEYERLQAGKQPVPPAPAPSMVPPAPRGRRPVPTTPSPAVEAPAPTQSPAVEAAVRAVTHRDENPLLTNEDVLRAVDDVSAVVAHGRSVEYHAKLVIAAYILLTPGQKMGLPGTFTAALHGLREALNPATQPEGEDRG